MNTNDIVIHPLKTKRDPELPESGIFFVNPAEAKLALATVKDRGGKQCFIHNSNLAVTKDDKFIAGPAVGAPAATLVLEKLIALGAKRITFMGWCGAVDSRYHIGDIIIPDGAVSGEGTSRYYSDRKESKPSLLITSHLMEILSEKELSWRQGNIWSTDAPYRESRSFLTRLNEKKQVVGVDMEFSALCSVARFRRVDFGAVMLVSDEIGGGKWKPGFKSREFMTRTKQLVELLLEIKV